MKGSKFISSAGITLVSRVVSMIFSLFVSVIIARVLGPTGKGIYTLAMLLPLMIIQLTDMGFAPATVYYTAKKERSYPEILGNNIIIGLILSAFGILVSLGVIFFLSDTFFSGVPREYLLYAALLVPILMMFTAFIQINLGAQRFNHYNLINVAVEVLFLSMICLFLLVLKNGVAGAITSRIIAVGLIVILTFLTLRRFTGGIRLKLNRIYLKKMLTYGVQAYLGNLISFLNHRIDILIINYFMIPREVGFYSIGVALTEKLWMMSAVTSIVLFPAVASMKDESKRKNMTPIIVRSVFFINLVGYVLMFVLGPWLIRFLYSDVFSPAIIPLRILIIGAFCLSVSKVLSSDISGRGKPIINTYLGAIVLVLNVILNIILIPRLGIIGAAWATTISYGIHFLMKVFVYCRISGNSWTAVLVPRPSDLTLFKEKIMEIYSQFKENFRI